MATMRLTSLRPRPAIVCVSYVAGHAKGVPRSAKREGRTAPTFLFHAGWRLDWIRVYTTVLPSRDALSPKPVQPTVGRTVEIRFVAMPTYRTACHPNGR